MENPVDNSAVLRTAPAVACLTALRERDDLSPDFSAATIIIGAGDTGAGKANMNTIRWITTNDEGFEVTYRIPAFWNICDDCYGNGESSAYLGAFTAEDFDEAFPEDDDRMRYLSGGYDRRCEQCNGTGKVLLPDDRSNDPIVQAYLEHLREEYEYRMEREAERRYGC